MNRNRIVMSRFSFSHQLSLVLLVFIPILVCVEPSPCIEKLLCLTASGRHVTELRLGSTLAAARDVGLPEMEAYLQAYLRGRRHGSCPDSAFACPLSSSSLLDELQGLMSQRIRPRRMKRQIGPSWRQRIQRYFNHPLFPPEGSKYRPECRQCEAKRSACFTYSIGTSGICGAVWLLGGKYGSWACNAVTLPRTIDCWENTINNCYLKNCGGFKF